MATELLVLGGERSGSSDGATSEVIEPGTGEPMAEVADAGADDARRAVDIAHRAFEEGAWPRMSATERGRVLLQLIERLNACFVRDCQQHDVAPFLRSTDREDRDARRSGGEGTCIAVRGGGVDQLAGCTGDALEKCPRRGHRTRCPRAQAVRLQRESVAGPAYAQRRVRSGCRPPGSGG